MKSIWWILLVALGLAGCIEEGRGGPNRAQRSDPSPQAGDPSDLPDRTSVARDFDYWVNSSRYDERARAWTEGNRNETGPVVIPIAGTDRWTIRVIYSESARASGQPQASAVRFVIPEGVSLVEGTPEGRSEGEDIEHTVVVKAVRAGEWQMVAQWDDTPNDASDPSGELATLRFVVR